MFSRYKYAKSCSIPCLLHLNEIQKVLSDENLRLSPESHDELFLAALKKVGATTAERHLKKLVQKGELKWNGEYEVELILDHYTKDDKDHYLIKWRGWGHMHNTWEPRDNLQCEDLLQEFHKKSHLENIRPAVDQPPSKKRRLQEVAQELQNAAGMTVQDILSLNPNESRKPLLPVRGANAPLLNRRTKAWKSRQQIQKQQLQDWQTQINKILTDPAPITVENNVDLEGAPANFVYINDYMPMDGIIISEDPIIGCECASCFDTKKQCCGPNAGGQFAYYKNKRVRVPKGCPIYECNKKCLCSSDCPNRVVQLGRRHKVCIFRTSNGRGWGVRALQRIPRGTFVMEYVGEVITFEEAEKRGREYDLEGMTYLFDLDLNTDDCPFTVDARTYGNVSHFVNHSCDPNLAQYVVWINNLDVRLPRIALFAVKDIAAGEELTFDYQMTGATNEEEQILENSAISTLPSTDSPEHLLTVKAASPSVNPMPHERLPVEQTSTNQASANQTSANQASAEQVSADQSSAEEPLAVQDSTKPGSVDQSSTNTTSNDRKSADQTSADLEPSGQTSQEDISANHTATEQTSVDETPNNQAFEVNNQSHEYQSPAKQPVINQPPDQPDMDISSPSRASSLLTVSSPRSMKQGFSRRLPPASQYRLRCQCGTKACRGYLY